MLDKSWTRFELIQLGIHAPKPVGLSTTFFEISRPHRLSVQLVRGSLNKVTRILEEEKKNAESAALLAYIEKLQHEDLAELERKRDTQIQIQKEIELSEQERMIQKQRKAAEEEILAEQVT